MHDARESGNHANGYDCRTLPERERADMDSLREALAYLTRRVEALEADGRTYRAALDAQGDALQLLTLRGKP